MLLKSIEESVRGYENCSWVFGWHDPALFYVNEAGVVAEIGDGGPLDPATPRALPAPGEDNG